MLSFACSSAFVLALNFAQPNPSYPPAVTSALARSGANAAQIERALTEAPAKELPSMEWLVSHMPPSDLTTLDATFLLTHVHDAFTAWTSAPWHAYIDEAIYCEAILPYASTSEKRELWMSSLREKCLPMIAGATAPEQAAVLLNQKIFTAFKVQYSTKRARADQSPSESMSSGLASCTGLSILLIDACRSVGIPARFVGVPMWTDGSGNHSWVEIYDGSSWHYTGAAEPTGDALDQGWFSARAAGQNRTKPEYAIYATTWRDTGVVFPMVFDSTRATTNAIDVTDRYLGKAPAIPAGYTLVSLDVREGNTVTSPRVERVVRCIDANGTELARGSSKSERFDTNDHLELPLPIGQPITIMLDPPVDGSETTLTLPANGLISTMLFVPARVQAGEDDKDNKDAIAEQKTRARPITARVSEFLEKGSVRGISKEFFATEALTKVQCEKLEPKLVSDYLRELTKENKAEFESKILEAGGAKMPFWYAVYGDKPKSGRSLYISMHGGGGAPAQVNDGQWENQKKLYTPKEGVYCAPRAPTDTWNLWHQGHIDPLFAKLIVDMMLFESVDPNRVYIMGYSAGGDGVYQLAPRMADYLAAAAMMAGHPNETKPDGLRNLPFTLHMGGEDKSFDRNQIGRNWKVLLDELSAKDVGGYPHEVVIHEGKGHWMDREDAVAVPWMAKYTRNLRPTKVIWLQDDVTSPRFYWLMNPAPKGGQRVEVVREGQVITIVESTDIETLVIRLDDSMLDLSKPVVVKALMKAAVEGDPSQNAVVLFEGIAPRTLSTMARTLIERSDATGIFTAEITVKLPTAAPAPQP